MIIKCSDLIRGLNERLGWNFPQWGSDELHSGTNIQNNYSPGWRNYKSLSFHVLYYANAMKCKLGIFPRSNQKNCRFDFYFIYIHSKEQIIILYCYGRTNSCTYTHTDTCKQLHIQYIHIMGHYLLWQWRLLSARRGACRHKLNCPDFPNKPFLWACSHHHSKQNRCAVTCAYKLCPRRSTEYIVSPILAT